MCPRNKQRWASVLPVLEESHFLYSLLSWPSSTSGCFRQPRRPPSVNLWVPSSDRPVPSAVTCKILQFVAAETVIDSSVALILTSMFPQARPVRPLYRPEAGVAGKSIAHITPASFLRHSHPPMPHHQTKNRPSSLSQSLSSPFALCTVEIRAPLLLPR